MEGLQEKQSIISELISLSKVDGEVSEQETALIKAMGNMMGMEDADILELFKKPVKFTPSKAHLDRITQFHMLVLLSHIDVNFTAAEKDHLMLVGIKLGLNPGAIEEVLSRMFDYPRNVIPPEDLMGIFKKHMN